MWARVSNRHQVRNTFLCHYLCLCRAKTGRCTVPYAEGRGLRCTQQGSVRGTAICCKWAFSQLTNLVERLAQQRVSSDRYRVGTAFIKDDEAPKRKLVSCSEKRRPCRAENKPKFFKVQARKAIPRKPEQPGISAVTTGSNTFQPKLGAVTSATQNSNQTYFPQATGSE